MHTLSCAYMYAARWPDECADVGAKYASMLVWCHWPPSKRQRLLLPSKVNLCCWVSRVYFHAICYFRHLLLLANIPLQFFLSKFFTFLCHFPLLVAFFFWLLPSQMVNLKRMLPWQNDGATVGVDRSWVCEAQALACQRLCVVCVCVRALTLDLFIYNFFWVCWRLPLAACNKCRDAQHVAEKYISKICACCTGWSKLDLLDFLIIHKESHACTRIRMFPQTMCIHMCVVSS